MKKIKLFFIVLGSCIIFSACVHKGTCPSYSTDINDIPKVEIRISDNM